MNIREARLEDVDKIHKMGTNVEEFSMDEDVSFWSKEVLENLVNSKTDIINVAEDKDKIIGFSICAVNMTTQKATYEDIFILPQYRGKDIANLIFLDVEKKLKKLGVRLIVWYVEEKNPKPLAVLKKNNYKLWDKFYWYYKEL